VNDATTATLPATIGRPAGSPLSRLFRFLIGDVRDGELSTTLLLLTNIFIMLAGYYICKTVREPLILLSGGAALKSYAAAGQAIVLMAFVPLYGWFASRVDRMRLLLGVSLFFIINLELFSLAGNAGVKYVGIAFFIWVGIFSNATIAQFWSYGNDLFAKPTAERLFPIIGIGATIGSPVGAAFAGLLTAREVGFYTQLHVAAACIGISMLLYWLVERREGARRTRRREPLPAGANGFSLLAKSPYLAMICLLLLVLNLVNTTGEFILGDYVVKAADRLAAATPGFNKGAYIAGFYSNYFFWVNLLAILLQTFIASRLVRHFGIAGVLFALPVVALGAYGTVAAGAGFMLVRIAKTAENATDYSIMNLARQLLWSPTSQEEKYKAKQAADSFIVRLGDVLSAVLVFVGTTMLALTSRGFAYVNLVVVVLWLGLAYMLYREYRRRSTPLPQ
jgi:AAA family ATP:ADP antiporter